MSTFLSLIRSNMYLWAGLSALLSVALETLFVRTESYRTIWLLAFPGAIAINYSAYRLIRVSPTLPDALILFTVVAWFMRLAAAHWLGQHIPHGTWYATILLLIAVIIQGRE